MRKKSLQSWARSRPRFSLCSAFGRVGFFCLLLTLYCFLPTSSIAQTTFERTYGGTGWDGGTSVQQTTDGGYIISGYTKSFGAGGVDFYLIKTNPSGDTVWTRTYGDGTDDKSHSVRQTSDGGYIIAGCTKCETSTSTDIYLIKTDPLGNTLWTRAYDRNDQDRSYSVQQTSDGGYIITGCTDCSTSDEDIYLVKTDSLGDTLWTRTFGGTNVDVGMSVKQTADGGYVIAGFTVSFGSGSGDVYLIKTDSLGDTLWTRTYGGTMNDAGSSVQQTVPDGGYIIAGFTRSFGSGSSDIYLIKTDSLGETLWTKTFGGTMLDGGSSVQQTQDGGYIIAGQTASFGAGMYDVYLIKTDFMGNAAWTRIYGGRLFEIGSSVQQTSDGGYIIVGYTESFDPGNRDVYLIKTNEAGLVGIEEDNPRFEFQSTRIELLRNHPNPFHPPLGRTVIEYTLPESVLITLEVYDITGRLVETLVDQVQEPGVYQVEWEGKNLSSGIYFYRLQSSDFTATKKLILLK
ncbi:T9SS type A sorting domain-containing protein [candidate division TA06 bacterium]|nr:T9SS type A sorting domain-containing protein [candidate division TA06 bacterium]